MKEDFNKYNLTMLRFPATPIFYKYNTTPWHLHWKGNITHFPHTTWIKRSVVCALALAFQPTI